MHDVQTAATQAAATPDQVVTRLREGNARFVAASPADRDLQAQIAATVDGQYPLAAVLGCIDSRVPVEVVFDQGIGDLFVSRTAGAVVDEVVVGGMEFATELAGAPVIVVLGHTACGAVKGACTGVELGHLTGLLSRIRPAVVEVTGGDATPGADDPDLVDRVVETNVGNAIAILLDSSAVLRARVDGGQLVVLGAVYDLASGEVRWLD